MTFKVTVVNKFSENVLYKGRNGAEVKAELFFIRFDKMFGKHRVSDTKRGRDRSWVVFSWMLSYTVEENLQTLCWKCNRSKSNKIANLKDY